MEKKQHLDGFEIQGFNQGWINVETGEIGEFKNGKPVRFPFWRRKKIELYEKEYLGVTEIEKQFIWSKETHARQKAAVYRTFNKITGKTRKIWVACGDHVLYFSPEVWDLHKRLVEA